MSSLTDEQKKRIEENRAKALAKLAQKKSVAQHQHQNNSSTKCPGNSALKLNAFYNKSHTFNSGATQKQDILNLKTFEYHRRTNETSPHKGGTKAPFNKTTHTQSTSNNTGNLTTSTSWDVNKSGNVTKYKSGNEALMKARVVNGKCVLMNKTRFKVVVGFHSKLIGILKSVPSKSYGRYQLSIIRKSPL